MTNNPTNPRPTLAAELAALDAAEAQAPAPQPERELTTEQVRELLEGLVISGTWRYEGGEIRAHEQGESILVAEVMAIPSGDGLIMSNAPRLARNLLAERQAHAATHARAEAAEAEAAQLRAALAEAEATLRFYAAPVSYCEGIAGNGSCDRSEYAEGVMLNWTHDEGKRAWEALKAMGVDFKPSQTKTCSDCEGFGYYAVGKRTGGFQEMLCDTCNGAGSVQEATQ